MNLRAYELTAEQSELAQKHTDKVSEIMKLLDGWPKNNAEKVLDVCKEMVNLSSVIKIQK